MDNGLWIMDNGLWIMDNATFLFVLHLLEPEIQKKMHFECSKLKKCFLDLYMNCQNLSNATFLFVLRLLKPEIQKNGTSSAKTQKVFSRPTNNFFKALKCHLYFYLTPSRT